MAGKVENKKLEEHENETITCFGDQTSGTFLILNWLGLKDEDNSVSQYGPITL